MTTVQIVQSVIMMIILVPLLVLTATWFVDLIANFFNDSSN